MGKKLIAPEGQFYTQAADVEPAARIFATMVVLGKWDAPENWRLADMDERIATEAVAAAEREENK